MSGVPESTAVVLRWEASVSRARHWGEGGGASVKTSIVASTSSKCFGSSAPHYIVDDVANPYGARAGVQSEVQEYGRCMVEEPGEAAQASEAQGGVQRVRMGFVGLAEASRL